MIADDIDKDTPGARLQARIKKQGESQKTLANSLDIDQSAISQFVTGKTQQGRWLYDAAKILETTYEWIMEGAPPEDVTHKNVRPFETRPKIANSQPQRESNLIYPDNVHDVIPLYGPASAGSENIYITGDNVIGERARPPELQGIKGGFRMLVVGDCMEPRHFAGEEVSVHPFKRPSVNDDCIVVMEPDGNAQLKRYLGESAKEVRLAQWNPKKEITVHKKDIRRIYAVVR